MPLRQNLIVMNIEGLYTRRQSYKVNLLRERMVQSGTIITALTETHLNSNILDAEVSMDGYQIIRADRGLNRKKGGVALYIRNDIAAVCKLICAGSNGVVEYIMVHIEKYNVVIMNIYRPPRTRTGEFTPVLNSLKLKIDELQDMSISVILCGDFNFPRTNFDLGTTYGGSTEDRTQAANLIRMKEDLCMKQIVDSPRRGENFLDLIFVNI